MQLHFLSSRENKFGSAHHPAPGKGAQAAADLFVHSRLRAVRGGKCRSIKLVPRQSQQTKDQFSAFVLRLQLCVASGKFLLTSQSHRKALQVYTAQAQCSLFMGNIYLQGLAIL